MDFWFIVLCHNYIDIPEKGLTEAIFWANRCMTALGDSSSTFWILQRWPFSEMEDWASSAVWGGADLGIPCLLYFLPNNGPNGKKKLRCTHHENVVWLTSSLNGFIPPM